MVSILRKEIKITQEALPRQVVLNLRPTEPCHLAWKCGSGEHWQVTLPPFPCCQISKPCVPDDMAPRARLGQHAGLGPNPMYGAETTCSITSKCQLQAGSCVLNWNCGLTLQHSPGLQPRKFGLHCPMLYCLYVKKGKKRNSLMKSRESRLSFCIVQLKEKQHQKDQILSVFIMDNS